MKAPTSGSRKDPITPERLRSIKVLYREPDTLSLWGVPYDMRPGQSPKDISPRHRFSLKFGGWIWLGTPGWFYRMSREEISLVKDFLDRFSRYVPGGPHEWDRIPQTAEEASPSEISKR